MRLHDLKPHPGAKHRRKRLGSGESSGHGKTCGKGHKDKGSFRRNHPPGFEGGQMPLPPSAETRFNNSAFKAIHGIVNLDDLRKRFDDGSAINEKLAPRRRIDSWITQGIKVLGRGRGKKDSSRSGQYQCLG